MSATGLWDAPDLVQMFKDEAGLADANEYNDISDICPRLSRAQQKVMELLAQRTPHSLYQAPTAMTRASDGKTYSFGTDAQGNAIVPMGYVQIAPNLSAFSGDRLFVGWQEDRDFLDEGDKIRIPSNRSYSGTLYARFVPIPPNMKVTGTDSNGVVVAVAVQPILNPAQHRSLIVINAVEKWAGEGNQRPDLVPVMKQKWADEFPAACLTLRKRYRNGGGLIDPAKWYFAAPDLGTTGS